MTQNQTQARPFSLSEDWLATIIGLVIVAIIGLGLLGPGPQSVALEAAPGESVTKEARALSGWKISAKLDKDAVTIADAPKTLDNLGHYWFICQDGAITLQPVDTTATLQDPAPGKAELSLDNQCDQKASLTYSTSAAVRWPLFGLFK